MGKAERIRQMIALTRACIAGGLTAAELKAQIESILTIEPELPLGIGTTTEAPK